MKLIYCTVAITTNKFFLTKMQLIKLDIRLEEPK